MSKTVNGAQAKVMSRGPQTVIEIVMEDPATCLWFLHGIIIHITILYCFYLLIIWKLFSNKEDNLDADKLDFTQLHGFTDLEFNQSKEEIADADEEVNEHEIETQPLITSKDEEIQEQQDDQVQNNV